MRLISLLLVLLISAAAGLAQSPTVTAGGVLNGASFDKSGVGVTPGSLVSIFGSNLASANAQASSIPLSVSLGNVSVTFNGVSAPMLGTFPMASGPNVDQLNVQLPWELTGTTVQVAVTNHGVTGPPQNVTLAPVSPGIFSIPPGGGQAIAINSDGSVAAPTGSIPGVNTRPAKIGDPGGLIILATGLGPVDSSVPDGGIPTKLTNTTTKPTVLIGNVPAQVVFSGLTPQFVGVNQVNVAIPAGTPTGNQVPIQIQMGGQTSSANVTIAVSQ